MIKIYNGDIPFDQDGNQLVYAGHGGAKWRANYVFEDTLTYVGFERGRSAAHFIFNCANGCQVIVFLVSLGEMMKHLRAGKIKGKFAFEKRGTNYGLKLLEAL